MHWEVTTPVAESHVYLMLHVFTGWVAPGALQLPQACALLKAMVCEAPARRKLTLAFAGLVHLQPHCGTLAAVYWGPRVAVELLPLTETVHLKTFLDEVLGLGMSWAGHESWHEAPLASLAPAVQVLTMYEGVTKLGTWHVLAAETTPVGVGVATGSVATRVTVGVGLGGATVLVATMRVGATGAGLPATPVTD